MTDDKPPAWMREDDHDEREDARDVVHDHDENSLASILGRAVAEINELGGRDRHTLAHALGRSNYEKLLSKPAGAKAIDTYLEASPKTKNAAGRLLAVQIAKVADEPKLVSRIENELRDAFSDDLWAGAAKPRSRHPRQPRSKNTALPSISGEPDKGRATNHQKEPTCTRWQR